MHMMRFLPILIILALGKCDLLEKEEEEWLESAKADEFFNWHLSLDVGGPFNRVLRPINDVSRPNKFSIQSDEFMSGLNQLQDAVAMAQALGTRIRAYGSKWSMSDVAYTDGILVETWGLTYCKIGIDTMSQVSPAYQAKSDRLVFSQTGVMIKYLNEYLAEAGYSLSTCGGSDGQRLGGAIATGTHAAFPDAGSMQEMVRGMHIVLNNETVYIQKASDPVVTNEFLATIDNPRLIEDDDIFGAALVNLGSMGLIHALLIEVEPLFPVRVNWKKFNYEDKKSVISSLNIAELDINGLTEIPFSFQVGVGTYNHKLFVGAYEKLEPSEIGNREKQSDAPQVADPIEILLTQIVNNAAIRWIDETFGSVFGIGTLFKRFLYGSIIGIGYNVYYNTAEKQSGNFLKDIWTGADTDNEKLAFPLPSTEMEMAVPVEDALEAIELISEILRRRPILHPLSVRYTKKSDASLEFTRFEQTATISLFGPWGKYVFADTEAVFEEIFGAIAKTDIPHCYHWGKKQPQDPAWVDRCLGTAKAGWMTQRARLLNEEGLDLFANEYLERLGLYVPS